MKKRKRKTNKQLNMELVNQATHKEERTMKKRSYVALIMAMVIMAVMLVACGEDQQQVATTTSTEPTQVAETPKPTEEPIQVPTATPTPIPTEAPTPTESPYVIDGYDFTEYYKSTKGMDKVGKVAAGWDEDSIRVIAYTSSTGEVMAVLKDGDSYEEEEKNSGTIYLMYFPKETSKVVATNSMDEVWLLYSIIDDENLPYNFYMNAEFMGKDTEVNIKVFYTDGTEESITLFITKEYVLEL